MSATEGPRTVTTFEWDSTRDVGESQGGKDRQVMNGFRTAGRARVVSTSVLAPALLKGSNASSEQRGRRPRTVARRSRSTREEEALSNRRNPLRIVTSRRV